MNWALLIFGICFIATFILRIPLGIGMMMSSIFYFVFKPGAFAGVAMVATLKRKSRMNSNKK